MEQPILTRHRKCISHVNATDMCFWQFLKNTYHKINKSSLSFLYSYGLFFSYSYQNGSWLNLLSSHSFFSFIFVNLRYQYYLVSYRYAICEQRPACYWPHRVFNGVPFEASSIAVNAAALTLCSTSSIDFEASMIFQDGFFKAKNVSRTVRWNSSFS